MSKFVRIALLVALGVVTVASAALAVVPDPTNSSCGTCLVVSPNGQNTDGSLSFTVIVKDQFGNPINNSNVVIDFGTLPVVLCSGQDPGFTAVGTTLSGHTNLSGTVVFTPRGHGAGSGTVKIYADGVQICSLNHVSTTDLNGDNLVDVADLAIFAADQIASILDCDLNCDGFVDVADLSLFAANQLGTSGTLCP